MRCAVHPARLATDTCPVCSRPRCQPDSAAYGDAGCAACSAVPAREGVAASAAELTARAVLATLVACYIGGWIATQYVRVHIMSLLAPGLIGVVAAWLVTVSARGLPARSAYGIAVVGALLGTALGFRLTPGGENPLHPLDTVLGPYLAGVVGVALWPLLFAVPRRQPAGDEPDAGISS